jgi:hypothetical protein
MKALSTPKDLKPIKPAAYNTGDGWELFWVVEIEPGIYESLDEHYECGHVNISDFWSFG